MSINKDNFFDLTVECRRCHDMFDTEIQLFTQREIDLTKGILDSLFTRCHNCGAGKDWLAITVSNEYFTAEEIRKRRKNEEK